MHEQPTGDAAERTRRAARVILVDDAGRLLLFRGFDPARPHEPHWVTPGGGIDAGEAPAEGAARELREETGLRIDPAGMGQPVHHEVTVFSFDGVTYRQEQEFFLVRVGSWEVDTAGFDEVERRTVDAHRWWTPAELAVTEEVYYPADLLDVVRRALASC